MPIRAECPIGKRFGRLAVIGDCPQKPGTGRRVFFQCDCGTKSSAQLAKIRSGETTSCGCFKRNLARARQYKHGQAVHATETAEYRTWMRMIARCHNPNATGYQNYGGRGISVCAQWRTSFVQFFADMGPRPSDHSIDRRDNDGDYDSGNCRWASRKQQQRNTSQNRYILLSGERRALSEWCEIKGLNYNKVKSRISRGWPDERALS